MGFYGNVTNTSKTTFSFDLVYDTRLAMDKNADTDGVFLGRYVLIDYDDSPIKGYAKKRDDGSVEGFYNTANFSVSSVINPRPDVIYQDLHNAMDALSFYKWDASQSKFILIQAGTPYQSRFQEDVKEYGRAYDSTVWVKRYDTTTERYKYAMIAELNAVIPTLHMIVDKPTSVPTTPYFDRDTTNIDYYLHMQSNYGMHIRPKNNGVDPTEFSDEKVQNVPVYWKVDNNGYQYPETGNPVEVDADIFYNNKGFDHAVRTFIEKEGYDKNVINYSMAQSGRKYGRDADQGAYTYGDPADDVYEWYIRLPGIGNAISNMWDKVYDDRGNNQKRALNKALKRQDTDNHLVSYDKNTVIGMMNTTQDLLGYHFIPTDDTYQAGYEVTGDGSTTITVPLKGENGVADYEATYRLIDCLFYDKPAEDNRAVTQYYHFAYTPTYEPFEGEELEEGQVYYHEVNGIWEVANNTLYKATDSNGNVLNTMAIGDYCTKVNKWTLTALEPQLEDNIYSLIRLIHDIIGTDEDDVRSLDTMKGTINHIKDIIANIDTSLYPGCLLVTDPVTGVIKTSETRFPAADWDKDELLAGDGQWVSRYASVKVRENSDNANRKIPKVVEFETTGETTGSAPAKLKDVQQLPVLDDNGNPVLEANGSPKMIDIELISDNQRDKDGTTLVYKQEHDPNTLIFATRDKWIKLHPDAADDSIEFEHTQSPIVHRLSYQVLTDPDDVTTITGPADDDNSAVNTANFKANEDGTEITLVPDSDDSIVYDATITNNGDESHPDSNDNRLTIPYITVDNAGHVIAASTKNYNIPHGFKKVSTSTVEDGNESASLDQAGISIAETISDTLNIAPRNRWIDIATETTNDAEGKQEDTITWSHRLVPTLNTSVVLNGERRTKEEEIPTVYRYGLPADKDIKTLDNENTNEKTNTFNVPYIEVDKAGHIVAAETHTVELPENFTTVTLQPQNESTVEADTVTEEVVLAADTLTDNLTLKTTNRWIGLGLTDIENDDAITFGHRLSDIKDVTPLALNGERHADEKYSKVYRYGLPQDKDISTLDAKNGIEDANTFNVPYVEIDEAGHIVYAETHTVQLPEGYTTINIGAPKSDDLTSDELAGKATVTADTLTESLTIDPSNKWIRLNAENTAGSDTITIGHEIHTITPTTSNQDLDSDTQQSIFTTQTVTWDEAGHIIGEDTKTWTLPDSFHNIKVIGESTSVNNGNLKDGDIAADETFDTLTFEPSNRWIRLYGNEESDIVQIGHLTQGIAGKYTGTDLEFTEFGGTVTIYGYETDNAGHIISNPTYSLTLPKGSYKEDENNNANVLTSLSFTDTTGALVGSKTNIGNLLLTDYTTENITSAAIEATDSLNIAIAKIEAQIKAEAASREFAITLERSTRESAVNTLQQNIDKEIEDREAAIDGLDEKISQEIEDRQTAVTEEATLREQADNAEVTARDDAIAIAVQAIWNDLLANYNLVLTPPIISSISKTAIDANYSVQLVANIVAIEGDTYSYSWDTGETGNTIEVTQAGTYTCTVIRTHNGYTSTATKSIDVLESEIPVPEVEEEETPTV